MLRYNKKDLEESVESNKLRDELQQIHSTVDNLYKNINFIKNAIESLGNINGLKLKVFGEFVQTINEAVEEEKKKREEEEEEKKKEEE